MLRPDDVSLLFLPAGPRRSPRSSPSSASSTAQGRLRHRLRAPARGARVGPAHHGRRRAPGVREGLQHGARTRRRPRARRIFDRAVERRHPLVGGARRRASRASSSTSSTRSSTSSCTASCAAAFGDRMRFAVSGGGPLGDRLTHFFNGIGVQIFEGYGLTETSPTLTVNSVDALEAGHRRPPGGRHHHPHRRGRRDPRQGSADLPGLLEQPAGHRRGDRRRRLVPHRRHRRARRRRLPAHHRSQEGDPRHRGAARTWRRHRWRTASEPTP